LDPGLPGSGLYSRCDHDEIARTLVVDGSSGVDDNSPRIKDSAITHRRRVAVALAAEHGDRAC
jgi:hypothetical protein